MPKYIDAESLKIELLFADETGDMKCGDMKHIFSVIDRMDGADVLEKKIAWIREETRLDITTGSMLAQPVCSLCRAAISGLPNYCQECGARIVKGAIS